MKFQPKSEKEVAEAGLWEKGDYSFEILSATEKTSRAGNDMIELKLALTNDEGQQKYVFDYLMESIPHKLRHAAYATGLGESYELGELAALDFEGRYGTAKVIVQKDKTGAYPDKNVIQDYIVSESGAQPTKKPQRDPAALDDDIPWQ